MLAKLYCAGLLGNKRRLAHAQIGILADDKDHIQMS